MAADGTDELDLTVVFFGELRRLAGCRHARVVLPAGSTVHDLARALRASCGPGFTRILTSDGDLQPHVAVYLNGTAVPYGVDTRIPLVSGRAEFMFVPMYEGG